MQSVSARIYGTFCFNRVVTAWTQGGAFVNNALSGAVSGMFASALLQVRYAFAFVLFMRVCSSNDSRNASEATRRAANAHAAGSAAPARVLCVLFL